MKAIIQTAYGEPKEVLKIKDVRLPAFDENSDRLLVRVHAVSLNPLDWKIVKEELKIVFVDPMPSALGTDLSGVVVKAGRGTGFKEGDAVFGAQNMYCRTSMAEYTTVFARNVALKPNALSHDEASCLGVAGGTAIQALQRHKGPKGTAFIPAGLGGVGSIALQLTKPYAGFKRTITTVSTAKVPIVKQYVKDVDQVIDYKKVDPETVIPAGSCDFVLEQFNKPTEYLRYLKQPAPGTKAVSAMPSIIGLMTVPNAEKLQAGLELRVSFGMRMVLNVMDWWTRRPLPSWMFFDSFSALPSGADMKIMADLADQGKLRPVIHKVFPMEQMLAAFAVAQTAPAGKVVIRFAD